MSHIELYITLNDTCEPYKCDITEHQNHWKCILYQEHFNYEIIKDATLSKCLQQLAKYLENMGKVNKIEGAESCEMFIAILETHLMINKSNRTINRQNMG